MGELRGKNVFGKDVILSDIVKILQDMTSDWEMGFSGKIGSETRLIGDLGFESIDIVQLAVAIEEHFNRRDLPFQDLFMTDGRYVEDLKVSDLVDFLCAHLAFAG